MDLFLRFFGKSKRPLPVIGLQFRSELSARFIKTGQPIKELGVIATRVITTEFCQYLVDALQDSSANPMDVFKYHDSGTGTNAEDSADTALQTPTGEAKDTGTAVEGASATIFRTVATHTYAGAFAVTEHGVFSTATGVDTLMDRSVFSAINVSATDQIEFTYECTVDAGG